MVERKGEKYLSLKTYLEERFPYRVRKLSLDTGLSCPNRDGTVGRGGCIYCDNRTINPYVAKGGLSLEEQIRDGMERLTERYGPCKFVAYFQTFTATHTSVHRLKEMFDTALAHRDVIGIAVSTRPDALPEEILDLLQDLRSLPYFWVEVGLQSINDKTLALLNRRHDADDFRRAVRALKKRDIKICAHVILGLPFEGRAEVKETAAELARLEVEGVKIHNLYVSKGTAVERMYREGRFPIISLEEYAEEVVDFLEMLDSGVVVHRIASFTPPKYLVAPSWASKPQLIKAAVDTAFEKRSGTRFAILQF